MESPQRKRGCFGRKKAECLYRQSPGGSMMIRCPIYGDIPEKFECTECEPRGNVRKEE